MVPVFLTSLIIVGCSVFNFIFILSFLTLQDALASSCIFPIPGPELPFLPGALVLLLECVTRNQDLGAGCARATGVITSADRDQEACVN